MQRVRLLVVTSLVGTGCGESLVSGEALDGLFGVRPLPARVAWEMRWLDEDGRLSVGCELSAADVIDDGGIQWGELLVTAPVDPEPIRWVEEEPGTYWALGLPVLVDAERYDRDWLEPDDTLSVERGVWGIPFDVALFYAEGDLELVGERLFASDTPLEEDANVVSVVSELVAARAQIGGSLLLEKHADEIWVFGGEVDEEDNATWGIWSGNALEGVVVEDCGE